MDLVPGASQLGAVEAPDRTAADNRDLHEDKGAGWARSPLRAAGC
jgi:hypothetical protein